MVWPFYSPSASEGEAINDECGAIAPSSTMRFKSLGVDFRVRGYSDSLQIRIRVPDGVTVGLTTSVVTLISGGHESQLHIDTFDYYDSEAKRYVSIPASDSLVGSNETFAFGMVESRLFETSILHFPAPAGDSYSVILPTIIINGVQRTFPVIQFRKRLGAGVYPINC